MSITLYTPFKMILSELQDRLDGQSKVIFDLLWGIVEGKVPKIDFLTLEETFKLFRGHDIDGVKSPFLLLSKDMVVKELPLMILQTTKQKRRRQRQMSVCRMFDTINKMLKILEIEAETLQLSDILL